jgi:hypothetical protein
MSLIFTEGFDTYASLADHQVKWFDRQFFWEGSFGSFTFAMVAGRYGQQAVRMQSQGGTAGNGQQANSYIAVNLGADYSTLFMGIAFNWQNSTGTGPFVQWFDTLYNTNNLDFRVTTSGLPYLTRNGTTLCTSSRAIIVGAWAYIEMAANISATAGWAEIYVDGILGGSYYGTGSTRGSANGNTVAATNASVRVVRVGTLNPRMDSRNNDAYYDDMYVCSSAGTRNNDVLGDIRVVTLLPTAAGNYSGWTRGGTDSGSNYGQVDETTYNSDTDYVRANVVGTTDTYTYADLPADTQSVRGVVAQFIAKKNDAGARRVRAVVRQGGVDGLSSGSANLTGSYLAAQLVMETNPVTGAPWTASEVNGDEFGVQISA